MKTIPVPGRFNCIASDRHLAGANQIYDDTMEKLQSTINSEYYVSLNSVENRATILEQKVSSYPTYDSTRECLVFPVGANVSYDDTRGCIVFNN